MTAFMEVHRPFSSDQNLTRNGYNKNRTCSFTDQFTQTISYECQHCDSRFTSKNALKHHETIHTIIYECIWTGCSNRFSNRTDYKKHMDSHTAERFLPCSYCSKSCDHRDSYKEHVKDHIEKPLVSCRYCSAKFNQMSLLRIHEKNHNMAKFVHLYKSPRTSEVNSYPAKSFKYDTLIPIIRDLKKWTNSVSFKSDSDRSKTTNVESGISDDANVPEPVMLSQRMRRHMKGKDTTKEMKVRVSYIPKKKDTAMLEQRNPSVSQDKSTTGTSCTTRKRHYLPRSVKKNVYTFMEEEDASQTLFDSPIFKRFTSPKKISSYRINPSTEIKTVDTTRSCCSKGLTFFNCSFCKYGTNTLALYRNHLLIHTRKTGFEICSTCQARFHTRSALTIHGNHCH